MVVGLVRSCYAGLQLAVTKRIGTARLHAAKHE
jgi:hypothetical protein